MNRLWQMLRAMGEGCGGLAIWSAVALIAASRVVSALTPPPRPHPVIAKRGSDLDTIDRVLTRRAPDLGLTLRHQLDRAIDEEARRAGYDPLLILAIIDVESDFDRSAVSSKGARGLMQIQPTTLADRAHRAGLRLEPKEIAASPALEVRLGVRYLRSLQNRFGNLDLALMAYNAGPRKIHHAIRHHHLKAFRFYPRRVRRDFQKFRTGLGLVPDWALAQRDRTPAGPLD